MKNKFVVVVLLIFAIIILTKVEKIIFPTNYIQSVVKYSEEFVIEPELVFSIIKAESSFNKNAVSHKGAIGLMQLMYNTAQSGAKELKINNFNKNMLFNPDINIRIGCWYIKELYKNYKTKYGVLAAYNAGGKNMNSWFRDVEYQTLNKSDFEKNIKYKETKDFFNRVLNNYMMYKKIYKSKLGD